MTLNSLVVIKKPKKTKEMAKYTSPIRLRHIPRDEFRAIVERRQGDKGVRKLSCWGQFVALFFGQFGQHSLRDLVTALDAGRKKLQQVGLEPLHAGGCEPQTTPGDLRGAVFLPVQPLSESGSRSAFRLPASGVQSGCAVIDAEMTGRSFASRGDQVTSDLGSRGAHPQARMWRAASATPDSILFYVDSTTNSTARGCIRSARALPGLPAGDHLGSSLV